MKIGLLNIRPDYQDNNVPISLPSSCDFLASYLNNNLSDCNAYVEYDIDSLMEKKPDMVGLSSFTRTYSTARRIATEVKKRADIPVIVGGHHISALPYNLDHDMDIGVLGEGEITLLEIVKMYEKGNIKKSDLTQIDGIVFRDEAGELIRTKPRELIKDIDTLPIPYRTPYKGVKGHLDQAIFTSRGCPFRCKYCAISEFWDKIRYHSPERVMEELNLLLSQTNCTDITIYDDLFGINKKRLKVLVDAIRSENIHKRVNFTCNARASVFDDEICQMFVDMNIKACVFGMESANDRILAYMKGSTTAQQNQRALELCEKYNIIAIPNFIIGFPTETKEEASDTYWFIRRNLERVNDFRVFPACPLPGTHLWDYAISKDIVKRDYDNWEELDFYFTPDKSVYLNQEMYDQYEYRQIMDDFLALKYKNKPFNLISGEKTEKYSYSRRFVDELLKNHPIEQQSEILEITDLNVTIKEKLGSGIKLSTEQPGNNLIDYSKYHEKQFDKIFILYTLELFANPESEILKLKKLLKDNGQIILATYNIKNPLFLLRLITGANIHNSWSEKEREKVYYYTELVNSHESEDKFSEMKRQFSENVYSYWGICNKDKLSMFEENRIRQLSLRTELKLLSNEKFFIEMDQKLLEAYQHLCKLISNKLKISDISDHSFSNISYLGKF